MLYRYISLWAKNLFYYFKYLMLFHSLPTRGHHVTARAHGRDSLDSTKLHRANILLFLYVILSRVMFLYPILTKVQHLSVAKSGTISHADFVFVYPKVHA